MKYFISSILILFPFYLFSQSLNFGFNSTHSGRNVTLAYEKQWKNHEFSFGVGYNVNKLAHNDDQFNFYKKRLFATDPEHHLNIAFTYQRYVLAKIKNIKPFVFYDLQLKYSTTRNRFFLPYTYDSTLVANRPEEGILYREYIENFGPFTWVEQNIGIGFIADLTHRIYLKQRFGVGVDLILGYEDKILDKRNFENSRFEWFDWEFSTLMQFSVGYRFKKKSS